MNLKFALLVIAYAICMAGSNLIFKYCADSSGSKYWLLFGLANITGFMCAIILPQALKLAVPNIVYSLCIGGGTALLLMLSSFLFSQSLSSWQWGGVGLIACGIVLSQVK